MQIVRLSDTFWFITNLERHGLKKISRTWDSRQDNLWIVERKIDTFWALKEQWDLVEEKNYSAQKERN